MRRRLFKAKFFKNAQICVETFETARRAPLSESPEESAFAPYSFKERDTVVSSQTPFKKRFQASNARKNAKKVGDSELH